MSMYCYQCEQTSKGVACTELGTCGKDATTATLQDLLVHAVKGISMYAHRASSLGMQDQQIDLSVLEGLFATVTNVDFDPQRLVQHLRHAAQMRDKARQLYEQACHRSGNQPEQLAGPAAWQPAADVEGLLRQGREVSIANRQARLGAELTGLQELIVYGLKGAAAYADHACILGAYVPQVCATFHELLDLVTRDDATADQLLAAALATGQLNLKVMALLDDAHTSTFGHPQPTRVRISPVRGKAIVVSGHDLKDLEELLKQTAGKKINVYTHGEMLPAHGYPGLNKYPHLVGNYGGAWQDQRKQFNAFPGAILMTTNCIQEPKETYIGRIFTSGLVAWPGVRHIGRDRDFTPVIEAALAAPGFTEDEPDKWITVGFGHHAVVGMAERIIEAVKTGAIRRLFLIGGCDGARPGRDYYTRLAEMVPRDCVILTLACGKYRFNKLDFGQIDGIPRLMDIGQCNDAYSAIQIALGLADAMQCTVNELPLSLVLSWYEQKAVAILLTLLYLGIKQIRIGPALPAFLAPSVLQVLGDKFQLTPITTPEDDLKAIFG